MKKTRAKRGCQIIDLYPPVRHCQACGGALVERYRQSRFVVTLTGGVRLIKYVLTCTTLTCPQRGISERPVDEGRWALPKYTFGLDVIACVGELRYQRQRTIAEIQTALRQQQVSISVKEVQLLSEVFLALVQTVIADDAQALAELRAQGGIILSADGIQPEKGNETLWLLRDVRSERVLVARNLLSSSADELAPLFEQFKQLGIPVLGVVSDKQASLCLAIERVFPNLPHQLCHYHYLRDAAQPLCDADRAFKKQLKQKLRGLRDVERQGAAREDVEADITRRYCLALREVSRDDGKYPLEPAGLQLYDKLQQIDASLARAIARRASTKLQRLRTLLAGAAALAKEHARLVIAWVWLYQLAKLLEVGGTRQEATAALVQYAESLPHDQDETLNDWAAHLQKLTHAFAPKLFAFHDQPLLPKTNNDLEVFIGQLKKSRRRVTGRKDTTQFILREGRAVACLQSLPDKPVWVRAFAQINVAHFRAALIDLRNSPQRSQAWQVRRDLAAYLNHAEQVWPRLSENDAAFT